MADDPAIVVEVHLARVADATISGGQLPSIQLPGTVEHGVLLASLLTLSGTSRARAARAGFAAGATTSSSAV
jgi:hypothetical protein